MSRSRCGGSRQPELFARSRRPLIPIEANHRLVVLTEETDFTELLERVERIRMEKVKSAAGRPPHLRALVGALMLKATRDMTWREAEDLIRHYAPARYLCGLTETEWSPDHTTLHDFAVLLGEEGVKLMNEYVVKWAVRENLADPRMVVADTTAQEAAIPYPNEMGLMAGFTRSVAAGSRRAGKALKEFAQKAKKKFEAVKEKVREYRLFGKDKTKAAKNKMVASMATVVERINEGLGKALVVTEASGQHVTKYGVVAQKKLIQLHGTMKKLIPQIRYWLRTGFVATGKVLSLQIPELYSMVREKAGKKVEFGLRWGISRLKGGFLLARLATSRKELVDHKFAVKAVKDQVTLFGRPPTAYAYDRGGHSEKNLLALASLGVKEVGLAPRGRAAWSVCGEMKEKLVKERAMVEAGIGTVKSRRYGFNRPRARSAEMMGTYGQMAILGFNLNKMAREIAKRNAMAIVG
jgi:hypothetical protein